MSSNTEMQLLQKQVESLDDALQQLSAEKGVEIDELKEALKDCEKELEESQDELEESEEGNNDNFNELEEEMEELGLPVFESAADGDKFQRLMKVYSLITEKMLQDLEQGSN